MIHFKKLIGYTACGLIMSACAIAMNADPEMSANQEVSATQEKEFGELNGGLSYSKAKKAADNGDEEAKKKIKNVDDLVEFLQREKEDSLWAAVKDELGIQQDPENAKGIIYETINCKEMELPGNIEEIEEMNADFQNALNYTISKIALNTAKKANKQKTQIGIFKGALDNLKSFNEGVKNAFEKLDRAFKDNPVNFSALDSEKFTYANNLEAIDTFGFDLESLTLSIKTEGLSSENKATLIENVKSSAESAKKAAQAFMTLTCKEAFSKFTDQINSLNDQKQELNKKLKNTSEKLSTYKKAKKDQEANIKKLNIQIGKLNEAKKELKQELDKSKREQEANSKKIKDQTNQIKKLRASNEGLKQSFEAEKETTKNLSSLTQSLTDQIKNKTKELENQKAEQEELVEKHNKKIALLNEQIKKNEVDIAELNEKLNSAKQDVENKGAEILKLQQDYTKLEKTSEQEQKNLNEQIAQLTQSRDKAQEQASNLKLELQLAKNLVQNQKEAIDRNAKEIADLKGEIARKNITLDELAKRNTELQGQIEALNGTIEEKEKAIESLKDQLNQQKAKADQELKEANEEINKLKNELESTKKEREELQEKLKAADESCVKFFMLALKNTISHVGGQLQLSGKRPYNPPILAQVNKFIDDYKADKNIKRLWTRILELSKNTDMLRKNFGIGQPIPLPENLNSETLNNFAVVEKNPQKETTSQQTTSQQL